MPSMKLILTIAVVSALTVAALNRSAKTKALLNGTAAA